jgi:hypothetical protein
VILLHIGLYKIVETSAGMLCQYDPSQGFPHGSLDSVSQYYMDGYSTLCCFLCRQHMVMACYASLSSPHKCICSSCYHYRGGALVFPQHQYSMIDDDLLTINSILSIVPEYHPEVMCEYTDIPGLILFQVPDSILTSFSVSDMSIFFQRSLLVTINGVPAGKSGRPLQYNSNNYYTMTYDRIKDLGYVLFDGLYQFLAGVNILPGMVGLIDGTGVLMMFGSYGTYTGLHLDISGAYTIALRVWPDNHVVSPEELSNSRKTPLAWWLFIRPSQSSIDKVNSFLSLPENKDILSCFPLITHPPLYTTSRPILGGILSKCKFLTYDQLKRIADAIPSPDVILLAQCNGDIMHPIPGYMHYVCNVETVLKFATEYTIRTEDLHTGVSLCRFAPMFGQQMAQDYVSFFISKFSDVTNYMKTLFSS